MRWPWTGRCGGAPRLLTRREDTGGPCEGGPGVKEALRSTAAGTFLRKGSPAAATSRAIQARTRLGLGTAGLVSLLESRRSHGELCRGRGAVAQRGRGGAESRRGGATAARWFQGSKLHRRAGAAQGRPGLCLKATPRFWRPWYGRRPQGSRRRFRMGLFAEETDHTADLRDPVRGTRLLEGDGAGETGRWACRGEVVHQTAGKGARCEQAQGGRKEGKGWS